MDPAASGSSYLGVLVARIRRVTLASGREIWTGYDDFGRQIVAVSPEQEPNAFDVHLRETPMSIAQAEDRIARRARKRSLAGIKAAISNIPPSGAPAGKRHSRSREAEKEVRVREILSRLTPIPEGGDDPGDL